MSARYGKDQNVLDPQQRPAGAEYLPTYFYLFLYDINTDFISLVAKFSIMDEIVDELLPTYIC